MRLLALLVLGAIAAIPQAFSFGVKGGMPVTDFLNARQFPPSTSLSFARSTTNRYIVGPTVELRLSANLAIEFDALFRRFRYQTGQGPAGGYQVITASANAWEFPLLLKYKLPGKFGRPYLDGGVAWDHLQDLSATATGYAFFSPPTTTQISNPPELQNGTSAGLVIGGGVEIHALFLRVLPEIRYTRWTSQHFASYLLDSNQDQAEVLLGITF